MQSAMIDLDWQRDTEGYVLVPYEPPPPFTPYKHPVFGFEITEPSPLQLVGHASHIVRKGGRLVSYQPTTLDQLCLIFAGVHSPPDLLAFMNTYGPLTNQHEENVQMILDAAEAFRNFLSYSDGFEEDLANWAGEAGKKITGIDVSLAQDPISRRLCMRFRPPSLLSALWLQLAQKLTGARPFRECLYCRTWFEVGPGTGRRSDAKFCIDDHRTLFHNHSRSMRGSRASA